MPDVRSQRRNWVSGNQDIISKVRLLVILSAIFFISININCLEDMNWQFGIYHKDWHVPCNLHAFRCRYMSKLYVFRINKMFHVPHPIENSSLSASSMKHLSMMILKLIYIDKAVLASGGEALTLNIHPEPIPVSATDI